MSSKEKLLKEYIQTAKNFRSLKKSLSNKKKEMYDLSTKIIKDKDMQFQISKVTDTIKILPEISKKVTLGAPMNKTLRKHALGFVDGAILSSLNCRMVLNSIEADSQVKKEKKRSYTTKYTRLNDSILTGITKLNDNFTKLEHLDALIKAKKSSNSKK